LLRLHFALWLVFSIPSLTEEILFVLIPEVKELKQSQDRKGWFYWYLCGMFCSMRARPETALFRFPILRYSVYCRSSENTQIFKNNYRFWRLIRRWLNYLLMLCLPRLFGGYRDCYAMSTRGCSLWVKVARTWSWPMSCI
jgi:hypothetical protein